MEVPSSIKMTSCWLRLSLRVSRSCILRRAPTPTLEPGWCRSRNDSVLLRHRSLPSAREAKEPHLYKCWTRDCCATHCWRTVPLTTQGDGKLGYIKIHSLSDMHSLGTSSNGPQAHYKAGKDASRNMSLYHLNWAMWWIYASHVNPINVVNVLLLRNCTAS